MASKHIYEYTVIAEGQTAPARVVRMVGNDKRVLEIGAGPGSITRILKQQGNCRVTGVEIDPTAIIKLTEFCEEVYQCDLNKSDWTDALAGCETFDVIVAADVFEHLYSPHESLAALKPYLSSQGYIVVSLPHVGNNAVVASILNGNFEYRDWGLLDKTHIRFFGLKNMQDLFNNTGYKIVAAEFVVTRPERTELVSHWNKMSTRVKAVLAENRFGSVYQVVIKAVPFDAQGIAIKLEDIPVVEHAESLLVSSKSLLRRIIGR